MQPTVRTLDQIMAELGSIYEPQVQSIQQRMNLIPEQTKAEEAGLQAKQSNAFDDILSGSRRRGLGFSGIPLSEQAKYTASDYLPAVARLRQQSKDQAMSLQDAIYGIKERQQNQALSQRQYEQQRYDSYQSEMRQIEAQKAAQRAAAAASAMPTLGYGGGASGGANAGGVKIPAGMQQLFNRVFVKGDGTFWDDNSLVNDYNATLKSANYGNVNDKNKIQLYHAARPDLFGGSVPTAVFSNGGRMTY
jgi:hypothetical protein